MLILDVNSAVIKHLRNEWFHSSDIEQENMTEKPSVPYIRATIIPMDNKKVEIGENGSSRYNAILVIDIFTALGIGIGEISELEGYIIEDIFTAGLTITSDDNKTIRFKAPKPLGRLDDKHGSYQSTVHCPFYFYH